MLSFGIVLYLDSCCCCLDLLCAASRGSRKTLGNFVKATFYALSHTYGFLSPDLWAETKYTKSPLQEFTGEGPREARVVRHGADSGLKRGVQMQCVWSGM